MDSGDWSAANRHHYGIGGAGPLQTTWLAWVRRGSPSLKRTPSPEMIAAADRPTRPLPARAAVIATVRQPRPTPNLLYREPRQLPAYAPGSTIASGPRTQTTVRELAVIATRPLPSTGWHATGSAPPPVTTAPATQPIRNQVTRPQPYQRPRPRAW